MARQVDCQIDERGRLTIPKTVRDQLGIKGTSADVSVTVEVIERHGENE